MKINSEVLEVTYYTSVKKACGWRSELVTATAEKISDKRCRVIAASMDSTGASKRQAYNAKFWAGLEVGKIKNIGALITCA